MNEQKHLTLIEVVLFLVVLGITFTSGYLLAMNKARDSHLEQVIQVQNAQPTTTTPVVSDITSDKKNDIDTEDQLTRVYNNNKFGFQITIPKDMPDPLFDETTDFTSFNLVNNSKETSISYLRFININNLPCNGGDSIIINGLSFIYAKGTGDFGGMESGSTDLFYCAKNDDKTYHIIFSSTYPRVGPNAVKQDHEKIYNEISKQMEYLNFKFIN